MNLSILHKLTTVLVICTLVLFAYPKPLPAAPNVLETKKDVRTALDRERVTLSGIVKQTAKNKIKLDYGKGDITVEVDDWDRYDEAYFITKGEEVTVTGRIDSGFYEEKTIEASEIYLPERQLYLFASSMDEEGDVFPFGNVLPNPLNRLEEGSWVTLTGKVVEIKDDTSAVVQTGLRRITVELQLLPDNPLDDKGYQKIKVGDRVTVSGKIDDNFFKNKELVATSLVSLKTRSEES